MSNFVLDNIIQTDKKCVVPGCDKPAVKAIMRKYPNSRKYPCCIKHRTARASGRVGRNFVRDVVLHNRKPFCEKCGTTVRDQIEHIQKHFRLQFSSKREAIHTGMQFFECDHIDAANKDEQGNKNNNPDNLQTLCRTCHRAKSLIENDYNSRKHIEEKQ